MDCADKERERPDYKAACDAEIAAVRAGNSETERCAARYRHVGGASGPLLLPAAYGIIRASFARERPAHGARAKTKRKE